jgi:hypothetical protein
MRDRDMGKMIAEETALEPFLAAFPRLTRRTVEVIRKRESPDFDVMIDGRPMGLELTEVRVDEPDEYFDEVSRLIEKKQQTYRQMGVFTQPVLLLCYSRRPPLYDVRFALDRLPEMETLFEEIWFMDLSDEYFDAADFRKPADLYCFAPEPARGFYEAERTRKPYG